MGFDNFSSFVKDHLREEAVAATVAGIAASIWLLKGRELGAASEFVLDAENATGAATDALHTQPLIGRNVPFGSSSLEQLQEEFGMCPSRPEVGPFSSTMPVSDRAKDATDLVGMPTSGQQAGPFYSRLSSVAMPASATRSVLVAAIRDGWMR